MKLTTIAAWILLFQVGPIQGQQRPAPKGAIEGIVARVGTGEPIAGARVTLYRSDSTAVPIVTTDAGGRFAIRELDAGSYRLAVAAKQYVRQEYGQRTFNSSGTQIRLAAGQTLNDITIHLTPAGSIEGRISESGGSPAVGVPVELLRATYDRDGQRILNVSGTAKTNDRGEYRLYWVTPGRYYINAGSAQGSIGIAAADGLGSNEFQEKYESAFYPGVTDISQAAVVDLLPGGQLNAIDFTLGRQRHYRIRGRVIDARTGGAALSANLSISYLSAAERGTSIYTDPEQTYDSTTGMFEIRDVSPGAYAVTAAVREKLPGSGPASVMESTAVAAVSVLDSDVDNVALVVTPAVSQPGRMKSEGQPIASVPGVASIRVQLEPYISGAPLPNGGSYEPGFHWANADGTFLLSELSSGEYRVKVTGLPPDYYVKNARLGQFDVLNEALHFAGAGSNPLEVTISPNGGRIDGSIVNQKQEPMAGVQAILIPDRQRDRSDLYKTATSDNTGHFTIRGIPPGDYKVFAWEALEDFAYFDPDLIRAFEQKGSPVRILESSKESVEVRIIQ